MRIAKDSLRETIQLVNTKGPLIKFEINKEFIDKKLGESRLHKLCTQPKEEKSPVYLLTSEVFELGLTKEWLISKRR
eukprot:15260975-Ditylum_brightwellii.AAC.2